MLNILRSTISASTSKGFLTLRGPPRSGKRTTVNPARVSKVHSLMSTLFSFKQAPVKRSRPIFVP